MAFRENTTKKLEAQAGKPMKAKHLKAMSIGGKISLVVLVLIVLVSATAQFIAPYDPLQIFTARLAPCSEFIFGTDDKGRDVLSRMIYGGAYSLTIGLGATVFALVFGAIFGAIAAVVYYMLSGKQAPAAALATQGAGSEPIDDEDDEEL